MTDSTSFIPALADQVQHNCHVSDARFGANYSMCIYLLKMREYFRWERGYGFGETLPRDEVGPWLAKREQHWMDLEEEDFCKLGFADQQHDAFDSEDLNQTLVSLGHVYSAGLGMNAAPHFFIGELEQQHQEGEFTIYISAKELARDLTSPPAMSQGHNIFLRREAFRRLLWERVDSWRWNRPDNAMGRALAYYDFDNDVDGSLEAMCDAELHSALLHEIGEIRAGGMLGNDSWREMIADLAGTPGELMARSIRDHIADGVSTLPTLLAEGNEASVHFYFGNLTNMRKHLFPSLEAAYEKWRQGGQVDALISASDRGRDHWVELGEKMIALHKDRQLDAVEPIIELMESSKL